MFTYFLSAFNTIVYVIFLERSIYYLENNNELLFYNTIYIFIGYFISYLTIKTLLRKRGWTVHASTARKFIQEKYIPKFVQLDNNAIEKLGTGKIIAILEQGISIWGNLFHHFFEQGFRVSISVIFTGYMIGRNSTTLLGIFFILYILMYISSYYFNLGTLKHRRKRRDWGNTRIKNMVKIIMSKNEILFTNKINPEVATLNSFLDKEIYYNNKMTNFLLPMFEIPRIIVTILIIFVLTKFGGEYLKGNLQLSEIVGLSTAFIVMLNTINIGIEFFKNFTKEFTDVEKLWDFFEFTPVMEGYNTGKTFKHISGDISLQNISYGYDENLKVFDGFSLDIPGNTITALVGPSGGGKSTLVKLISGYIRQDSGDILVDCQNLKDVSLKSYYKDVGYLTQEPSVFDGTVIENLLYAVETENSPLTPLQERGKKDGDDYSRQRKQETNPPVSKNLDIPLIKGENETQGSRGIDEIIKLAHCEFIYNLPNGLETEIGERGVKLSGGQKQRLAIAKIFLKDPKIIILDEPTSALDSLSEQKITEAMHNLFAGRTVLIIAHRLQTVKHANEIIVIDSGKVVERGTHNSLVRKNGYYKQMLDLQSGF